MKAVGDVLSLIGVAALFGAPAPTLVKVFLVVAGGLMLVVAVVATLIRAEGQRSGSRSATS